ncbi:hypothetical protein SEA_VALENTINIPUFF_82 [Microbacterium phage ValentiniPuff]|uniref:Holin n=1 Tax=Microbacterium phage ValentiniPuff TaxID=2315705 RepID=A0A386KSQ5_9CAUD|nr:hypothetical protein SEA_VALENTINIPUFF_82 [Microbacterium phage ValentiniPuff]
MPAWFWEMQISDWFMVIFGLLQLVFLIDYCRSPFWLHPIGYIVVAYSFAVLLLVFLILYGMVAGQRVDEWARTIVTFLLILSIVGKIVILHYERARGLQLLADANVLHDKIAALEAELAAERARNARA